MNLKSLNLNFRKKMLLTILPITITIFVVVGFSIYNSSLTLLEYEGKKNGRLLAESYASKLETEFAAYIELEKNFHNIIVNRNAINVHNRRQYYKDLIRTFLENNPKILSFWVNFDKNAFDEQDNKYQDIDIYGEDGRFNFICSRGKNIIEFEKAKGTAKEEGSNDWLYAQVKQRGTTMVTEPFRFSYTGNPADEQLMTTILSPIFNSNNQMIGAVGMNISLDNFVIFLNQLKPFESEKGYALLFSAQGIYLSRPDGKLLGKTTLDNPMLPRDVAQSHYNQAKIGKHFDDDFFLGTGARSLAFFAPVILGETEDRMMIGISVPYDDVVGSAGAGELLFMVIMFFGIALVLITIVVSVIASRLVKPLKKAVEAASQISHGNFDVDLETNSNDETAMLMQAMEDMVRTIHDMMIDIKAMIHNTIEGNLEYRTNIDKHKGDFKKIMNGINELVEAFIDPISETGKYLASVAMGEETTSKITKEYKGDFNDIKNSINTTSDALNIFWAEITHLSREAKAGNLSQRADTSKVKGAWSIMLGGVNDIVTEAEHIINDAGQTLQIMATGDLTPRITADYVGKFADMKNNINQLGDSLTDLISRLEQAILTTASASAQISATADTLATAMQEQSSQTHEIATAMEEMSKTVIDNATTASRTAEIAKQSDEVAHNGGLVVKQTVGKMREIANVVKISAETITKLGASSKKIGEIINVIDNIADQTNLLSLNAAIEAARAGEQGKGFAVVADSVGRLAVSTAAATKEIADMVKGIQKDTESAVKTIEQGMLEVQSGIELADNAGHSIENILVGINELYTMVNQIATANEEQSATSGEISQNISSISKVTSESAHNVGDVASTADELAKMTETLTALVSQFKIDVR